MKKPYPKDPPRERPLHRLSLFAIRPADDQVVEVLKSLQLLEVGTRERHAEILVDEHHDIHQIEAVEVERFEQRRIGGDDLLLHFEFVGQNGIDFFDEFLLCHCLRGIYLHFLIMRVELVPPNPNEFDRKRSKARSTLRAGMLSFEVASSPCAKLMFGAMNPCSIISIE